MDFADPKGTLNYHKCRGVLIVRSKQVDVQELAPETEQALVQGSVETVEDSLSASARRRNSSLCLNRANR